MAIRVQIDKNLSVDELKDSYPELFESLSDQLYEEGIELPRNVAWGLANIGVFCLAQLIALTKREKYLISNVGPMYLGILEDLVRSKGHKWFQLVHLQEELRDVEIVEMAEEAW